MLLKGNEGGLVLRPGWINLSVANWSWHKREVPDPHLQYQMAEEKQTQCELACIMENQLSNGELLRQAAAEVLIAVSVIARAMMLKAAVAATKPAEVGILMRAGGMSPGRHCGPDRAHAADRQSR
jgi:hypothetical protein